VYESVLRNGRLEPVRVPRNGREGEVATVVSFDGDDDTMQIRRDSDGYTMWLGPEHVATAVGNRRLLLHHATVSGCGAPMLMALLAANPAAAAERDADGNLPVYHALCSGGLAAGVVFDPTAVVHAFCEWSFELTPPCEDLAAPQPKYDDAFEGIIDALLKNGADPEQLLLSCADLSLLAPAKILVERYNVKGTEIVQGGGRIARDVGTASSHKAVAALFGRLGAYLGRYQQESGPPVHRSATCEVIFAQDVKKDNVRVALKLMRNKKQFEAEVTASRPAEVVIALNGWHTPEDEMMTGADKKTQEAEGTDDTTYPYVLVMECAERSLHDACAKER